MKNKKWIILSLIFILLTLWGCNKPSNDKVVTKIGFAAGSDTFNCDLDDFRLADILLEVTYNDKSKEVIPVTIDMLSKQDFELLFTTGIYFITIEYSGKQIEAVIIMSSEDGTQTRLPSLVVYTIKTIEDNEITYKVYYTGSGSFISYQLEYTYNQDITNIEVSQGEDFEGIFVHNANDGKLTILYSQGESHKNPTELFTVTFNTNNNADLVLNEDNSMFLDYNPNVYEINDLKFYQR